MVVIRDPKIFYFYFDWTKDVDKNLNHKIEFVIKSNESVAENNIKNEAEQLLSKYEYGSSKADETLQFVLNLSKRLDLRSSNKNVALQNFSIYYMWKNIRRQDKNNKLKTTAPIYNHEFELPGSSYSVSDI